jgi:hypothetical protein
VPTLTFTLIGVQLFRSRSSRSPLVLTPASIRPRSLIHSRARSLSPTVDIPAFYRVALSTVCIRNRALRQRAYGRVKHTHLSGFLSLSGDLCHVYLGDLLRVL